MYRANLITSVSLYEWLILITYLECTYWVHLQRWAYIFKCISVNIFNTLTVAAVTDNWSFQIVCKQLLMFINTNNRRTVQLTIYNAKPIIINPNTICLGRERISFFKKLQILVTIIVNNGNYKMKLILIEYYETDCFDPRGDSNGKGLIRKARRTIDIHMYKWRARTTWIGRAVSRLPGAQWVFPPGSGGFH